MRFCLAFLLFLCICEETQSSHQQTPSPAPFRIRLVADPNNPGLASPPICQGSADGQKRRCEDGAPEGKQGVSKERQGTPKGHQGAPDFIRSWTTYQPYLYRAEPADAAEALGATAGDECGLVLLLNGRGIWEGRKWKWIWTWPWHFLKKAFEEEGTVSRILLLTPQPSNPSGCLYTQIKDVASLLSLSLALNTEEIVSQRLAGERAATREKAPKAAEPLLLRGKGLLQGCKRVRVYVHTGCHGALVARALLTKDDRIWKGQGAAAAAAGAAVAQLQRQLLSPYFLLSSITFTIPPLAGVRETPRLVGLAEAAGGPRAAAVAAKAARIFRFLKLDKSVLPILVWARGSGRVYIHRDNARLLCFLAAAEAQTSNSSSSSSNRGSLLLQFERIAVFATLHGDIIVSPRSAAGVSDEFQNSAAATKLLQQAAAAEAAAAEATAAAAGGGAAAVAAAVDAALRETPEAFLPHRLPLQLSPLHQRALGARVPEDIAQLLLNPEVCREPQKPHEAHKLYELTLQLLQLWGLLQQLQQQQQRECRAGRPQLWRLKQRQRPLLPDSHVQEQQQILRFVVYIPSIPKKLDVGNTPHFLALSSRSWMIPAAAPLLRAVAAATVGSSKQLQKTTVMLTDSSWWHA